MNLQTEVKGVLASWTLWFNTVALPFVFTLAAYSPEIVEQLPMLKAYLPDNMYKWAFIAAMVGNVILRFKTKTAVRVGG